MSMFTASRPLPSLRSYARAASVLASPLFLVHLAGATPLQSAPVSPKGKTVSVPVRIVATKTESCSWGDMDVIEMEMKASKAPLLLSLEPLGTKDKGQAKDVSSFDFSKGVVSTFSLPVTDKPVQYGIYLCRDAAKQGSCTGKALVDPATLVSRYLQPMDPATGKPAKAAEPAKPTDHTYYFGYLYVSSKEIGVMRTVVKEQDLTEMEANLKAKGVTDAAATIQEVKAKRAATMSLQPVLEDGVVTVSVPKLDQSTCKQN